MPRLLAADDGADQRPPRRPNSRSWYRASCCRDCEGYRRFTDTVKIEVIDTGPGVPEEIRQRIFDPFFTTKPIGQGTGLGLSISYSIITDHAGRITVDNKPGQGARFTVTLRSAPTGSLREPGNRPSQTRAAIDFQVN